MKFERKVIKNDGKNVTYDNMGKFLKVEKPETKKQPKEQGK